MKSIIGGLMILGGIVLGLYIGGYLCLIGGTIQIIEVIQADTVIASHVAWGIARILLSGFCGFLSALVLIVPGVGIIKS